MTEALTLRSELPTNPEAEALLLGALLIDNSAFDTVADILKPGDFFEPVHSRIYETGLSDVMAGRPATAVTLKGRFDADEGIKALGGTVYLAQLMSDQHGLIIGVANLARTIREAAKRRSLVSAGMAFIEAALDQTNDLATVGDGLDAALGDGPEDGIIESSAGACIDAHLRALADGHEGVTCGAISSLDKLLGPLRPGQSVVWAARPGMGKTAMAISYALGAARRGHGVLFVSLEMSGPELGARMAANRIFGEGQHREVPFACINSGRMNQGQRERVGQAVTQVEALPLVIADAGSLTVGRLDRMVRRHARRFDARGSKLELVIVDYLQLLRTDQTMRSAYEAVSEISRTLKAIAKTNGVALVALAQLSREVEKRGDKRPILADLRDSGQIEQDADAVLFMLRQEYYLAQAKPDEMSPKFHEWQSEMEKEENRIEFILAKRRNGVTGTAIGEFHGAYQAVLG